MYIWTLNDQQNVAFFACFANYVFKKEFQPTRRCRHPTFLQSTGMAWMAGQTILAF